MVGLYPAGDAGLLDVLVWATYQWGEYGIADQAAYAVIVEAGYQLKQLAVRPWLRLGCAHASGDARPESGVHKTFFNLTPTNHPYYGSMDTIALSNLINPYVQFLLKLSSRLELQIEGHVFGLHKDRDSWYSGSGPSSNKTFGYLGGYNVTSGEIRRLTHGHTLVGAELDLNLTYYATSGLSFAGTYARFFGAEGARAVYPARSNADWVFLQVTGRF